MPDDTRAGPKLNEGHYTEPKVNVRRRIIAGKAADPLHFLNAFDYARKRLNVFN